MNKTLLVVVAAVVVIGLYGASVYNGLVRTNEGVDAQWAQVETQYQRRFDLIPNLVASVQGAMKQEKDVFSALADARAHYAGAQSVDEKAAAAGQVETAFGRLLAIMENYPQLKSVDTVQSLMAEISGTENRISVERMRYNEMVRDYNIGVKTFPRSLMASLFGFHARTMFEAATGAEIAPKVQI
jgi:LemA protein